MEFKPNLPVLQVMKKLTSKDWEKLVPEEWGLSILDPDGWDRTNFIYSFEEELITKDEFMNRVIHSTIRCNVKNMLEFKF